MKEQRLGLPKLRMTLTWATQVQCKGEVCPLLAASTAIRRLNAYFSLFLLRQKSSTNSSLFFLHTIKAGGFCQISRHEGETGNVDCMDATEASAIISISGEPDPFGMEIVRIRSRPRAIHAALQTTA
jgi:hypothetical protein